MNKLRQKLIIGTPLVTVVLLANDWRSILVGCLGLAGGIMLAYYWDDEECGE